jgi:predicted HicB family RNase H-like nuclease
MVESEVKEKPEAKDLYLTVPPALYDVINKEAERQGQTLAALIRGILNEWAGELFAKQVK